MARLIAVPRQIQRASAVAKSGGSVVRPEVVAFLIKAVVKSGNSAGGGATADERWLGGYRQRAVARQEVVVSLVSGR